MKPSAASASTACAALKASNVPSTGASAGSRWRRTRYAGPKPSRREACTASPANTGRATARPTRKYSTHSESDRPRYSAQCRPGARPAKSRTSSRPGTDRAASDSITSARSTAPPRQAATRPSSTPGTAAVTAASKASPSESCAAWASRAITLRPKTSVPSHSAAPGGARLLPSACAAGSVPTTAGPKAANRASASITARPARVRLRRRAGSAVDGTALIAHPPAGGAGRAPGRRHRPAG